LFIRKERFISTATSSTVRPGAAARRHRPRRLTAMPNWLKCAPFVGLHVACLAVFLTGFDATALVLCGATYLLRMFGITAGYHRYFSHRAYKTSRVGQFLLAWLGCSALQKGPLWWASHHREHHRYSDTPEDPHSPHETSFWWSHVGWILSEDHVATPWGAIRDWARYPELRWLDRNHWVPGIVLAVGCFLIGGWTGLVWGFVISTVLVYHATFAINSLNHLLGTRRYATSDDSRNNLFLALLTLGEGWHNNHHHYQSSANQGFFWWEVDISYYILRLLGCAGLVWDLRTPGDKALTFRTVQPAPTPAALAAAAAGVREEVTEANAG
jgi:stearoyl-CoA desaturase (delta-9 desaturase)